MYSSTWTPGSPRRGRVMGSSTRRRFSAGEPPRNHEPLRRNSAHGSTEAEHDNQKFQQELEQLLLVQERTDRHAQKPRRLKVLPRIEVTLMLLTNFRRTRRRRILSATIVATSSSTIRHVRRLGKLRTEAPRTKKPVVEKEMKIVTEIQATSQQHDEERRTYMFS